MARPRVPFFRVIATRLVLSGLIVLGLASPASLPSDVTLMYRAALGTSVPVPVGWPVVEYQGTSVTVMSPPVLALHGPRITVEHLPDTVDVLVRSRCRPPAIAQPAFEGPMAIAGHPGSYQYLCAPRTFIGPEWTVVIPTSVRPGAWRLTYLGAPDIGSGSLSRAFGMVLANFSP